MYHLCFWSVSGYKVTFLTFSKSTKGVKILVILFILIEIRKMLSMKFALLSVPSPPQNMMWDVVGMTLCITGSCGAYISTVRQKKTSESVKIMF